MRDPLDGFPPETFRSRRDRLFEKLGADALVLPAAPARLASRDTEHPYRPDSELFWTTGAAEPGVVALLRGHAEEDRFVLFVRRRDEEAEMWAGPRRGPEGAMEAFGADTAYPLDELEDRFPDLVEGADRLYYRLGDTDRVEATVRRALRRARRKGQRKGEGPRGVLDPGLLLDPLRLRKDPAEIDRLRRAAEITVEAHRRAMAGTRPGMGEWELQALVEYAFRSLGADGPAYGTIVAGGANACVLHYVANADRLGEDELVLVDAGAAVGLYAADVTRTFPVGGTFAGERKAVYEVVERARTRAVEEIRPGATVARVHETAKRALAEGLIELGVLGGEARDVDEVIETEAYKPYFPHRTSHWLGLDVHDPGDYASAGRPTVLEPGMALTVEPGLYFRSGVVDGREDDAGPGGGGDVTPFAGIGVRIEDVVVVTDQGREVLSSDLPTGADEVARLVGSGG